MLISFSNMIHLIFLTLTVKNRYLFNVIRSHLISLKYFLLRSPLLTAFKLTRFLNNHIILNRSLTI